MEIVCVMIMKTGLLRVLEKKERIPFYIRIQEYESLPKITYKLYIRLIVSQSINKRWRINYYFFNFPLYVHIIGVNSSPIM